MRIGIIADTHGQMRPEACAALRGMDRIYHAGDVGRPAVLRALEEIAPLVAIRGNVDRAGEAADLPERVREEWEGVRLLMLHDIKALEGAPDAEVVISGHSHKPSLRREDGTLWLNPGAAGPRRFHLPVSVALLHLSAGRAEAELRELEV